MLGQWGMQEPRKHTGRWGQQAGPFTKVSKQYAKIDRRGNEFPPLLYLRIFCVKLV